MNNLTAVVLTKNEEKILVRCLTSLQWCDQILVIDDYSEDDTTAIAKKHGAKVFQHRLDQNFAQQRNFALKQVNTEWTLFVDADEQVTPQLAKEIQKVIVQDYPLAFRIKRQDIFLGKHLKHGETPQWNQIRLSETKAGEWVSPVHELWRVPGTVGQLHQPLLHYSHDNLAEFLNKINQYTTIAAQHHFRRGHRSNWWQIIVYPGGKFIRNYLLRLGLLDGSHGFVHAALMSFHSFLVRSKLYLIQRRA